MADRLSMSNPGKRKSTLLFVLLVVASAKLLILAFDSAPRFFLWDSVTYLRGAVDGVLPRDRSFLYSLLIGATAVPSHSLHALILVQTLAGIGAAGCVFVILRNFLATSPRLAMVGAVLVAVEPAKLLYERMVMAEAVGGAIWLVFVLAALAYLRSGKTRALLAVALAGIASIAFRLNGTATVLIVGTLLPLWCHMFRAPRSERPRWQRTLAQLAVAVAATLALHTGYRDLVGEVAHTRPGYIGTEGLFLLGYVAPVVKNEDFAGTGCNPNVLHDVARPLSDPRSRNYQLWGPNGLWAAIQHDCPQPEAAADAVARVASHRIWPEVLPMALSINAQYFDDNETTWRLQSDLGRNSPMPLELIDMARDDFHVNAVAVTYADTLTSSWFVHSRWWLTGCFLLAPLIAALLIAAVRRHPSAAYAKLLALIVVCMFSTQFLFSPVMEFRYLYPFPTLAIVCAIGILARLAEARPSRVSPIEFGRTIGPLRHADT